MAEWMFHFKQLFTILIWTHLCHLSFACFSIWLFLRHPQLLPYPGTLLPLGSCRWTEEVLHDQSKDHQGERCSVTALTTVWPTEQQDLWSGTQFLPDMLSLVPANRFESTGVNRITGFLLWFPPFLYPPLPQHLESPRWWGEKPKLPFNGE